MSNSSSVRNIDAALLFAWTDAFENPVAPDEVFELVNPWTDGPTAIAPSPYDAAYESTRLDAASLFADLNLAPPPEASLMLPPASLDPEDFAPPMIASAMSVPAPMPITQRREAPTVRTRPPPPMDATRARAVALLICGSLALIAALAACFVYMQGPQAPAKTLVTRGD